MGVQSMNQNLKVMKKLIVILVSAIGLNAFAQDSPKHMNVLAVNGLNMRSKPESNARVVTKVDYGKQVEIVEKTQVELKLGWVSDHWYKVRFRGREGFIYGGYLSHLPAPNVQQTQAISNLLPLYCTAAFTNQGSPIVTSEVEGTDTLKVKLIEFTNGAELELEQTTDRSKALLILPVSVQEAYVLLEAFLKSNNSQELLNELRFIRSEDGTLSKVNNANGTISIKGFDKGLTAMQLTDFLVSN